jgi:hypothetical protein
VQVQLPCLVSEWSAGTPCSASCAIDGGTTPPVSRRCCGCCRVYVFARVDSNTRAHTGQYAKRTVDAHATSDGAGDWRRHAVPSTQRISGGESEHLRLHAVIAVCQCNTLPCPVDCQLSAWSAWSACSGCNGTVATASGWTSEARTVLVPAQYGGQPCGAIEIEQPCTTTCDLDCLVSAWCVCVCVSFKQLRAGQRGPCATAATRRCSVALACNRACVRSHSLW